MKNLLRKNVGITIILILTLSFMGSEVLAVDRAVTINQTNNVVHLSGPAQLPPRNVNMSPGGLDQYTISITNNTGSNVNLRFIEATETVVPRRLRYFDLRVYINNVLSIEERVHNVTERHLHTIAPGETVNVRILIGLSRNAGNQFQNARFTILWEMALRSPIIIDDDDEIDLGIVQGVEEEDDDDRIIIPGRRPGGGITLIPETGQSRIIFYALYLSIGFVLILIAIILLKRDREEEEEDDDGQDEEKNNTEVEEENSDEQENSD